MTTEPVATSAGTMPSASMSDLDIARSVRPRPIVDVARDLGLRDDEIEPYGSAKAKITLAGIERLEAERVRDLEERAGRDRVVAAGADAGPG